MGNTVSPAVDVAVEVIGSCVRSAAGTHPDDVRRLLAAREDVWGDERAAWNLAPSLLVETKRRKLVAEEAASQNGAPDAELRLAALQAADAYFIALKLYDALRRAALFNLSDHRADY